MNRAAYNDYDCDDTWQLIMWRGAVARAIRGKRGQAFLRDLLVALDNLPSKRLIRGELQTASDEVCALGALGKARRLNMTRLDPENHEGIARAFGIADALARETMWENDDAHPFEESPERRYTRMRAWVQENIRATGK